jgi:hypothetical protein
LHFCLLACFCKLSNFGTNNFFLTPNLITHLPSNHHQLPITPNYNLCP